MNFFDGTELVASRLHNLGAFRLTPGSSAAAVGVLPAMSATRMEAVVGSSNWQVAGKRRGESFVAENVRTVQRPDGRFETSGRMTSHNALGMPGLRLAAIYFSSDNQIVGAQELVFNHCGCGVTPFTIVTDSPIADLANAEVFMLSAIPAF